MIGRESFAFLFPEDVEAAQRLFDAKTRGDANPFHFRLRREDGSAVWVDVQGTPMHNAAGAFRGIVGTFSISNQKGGGPNEASSTGVSKSPVAQRTGRQTR